MKKIMFRELSEQEEKEFRQHTRENPVLETNSLYHPVVNNELKKMMKESWRKTVNETLKRRQGDYLQM